jgi:hypothetical protein
MTMLAGTGQVYYSSGASGVGRQNREDLSDMITNISPAETPFLSNLSKASAQNVYHEWLTHTLVAAATAGGLEGDVASFSSPTTLTRDVNICQINRKYIAVSGTQEAVNKAGMKSEMAYRVINATKEIKRDLEMAMFQNTQYITGGSTTARSLKGVAGFATSVSTSAAVTAALVNSMLQTLWDNGGYPEVMYVNGAMKGKLSQLAAATTTNYSWDMKADAKKFSTAVDVWDGDFGVQRIVAAHQMTTQSVAALELQHWKHATLRPLQTVDLAVDGDNVKKMIQMESTLECRAPLSSGYYTWTG